MKPYTITELARTGVIAMARGSGHPAHETRSAHTKPTPRTRSLNAPPAPALPPS